MSTQAGCLERPPSLPAEPMVLEGRMFGLFTRLGKYMLITSKSSDIDKVLIRVHVCVGDMNAEQGEKLASELPG